MNKDYCFTFQQHDFDYEPQTQQIGTTTTTREDDTTELTACSGTYEMVPNEEDVLDEKQSKCSQRNFRGYYFNAPKIATTRTTTTNANEVTNKNKLHLNLNTEQISLKSQNNKLSTAATTTNAIIDKLTINKSMAAYSTTHNNRRALANMRNLNDKQQEEEEEKVHNKLNGISFKIAPLNMNNNKDDDEQQNLPEIVLTSFEAATTTIMPKKGSVKFQGVNQPITVNSIPLALPTTTMMNDKLEEVVTTDAEDSSELTSLPGNSTSPESILDNILSAASSVSVCNSSSLSSVGSDMTQLGVKELKKNAIMPQVVILHANEEVEQQKPLTHKNNDTAADEQKNNLHMHTFINWPNTKKKSQLAESSPKSRLSVRPQLTPTCNNSGISLRSPHSRWVKCIMK